MSRRRQSRHTKTYKILFILFEYGLNSEKQNCGWIFRFSINRFYYRVSVVLLHASLFTNVPSSAVGTLARNYRQRAGWVLHCSRHLNGFQFQLPHPFHLTPPHPTSKKCRNHWLYGSWCAVWLSSLFHCGLDPSCSIHSVWKIPKEFWIRHKNSKFWKNCKYCKYCKYWKCWKYDSFTRVWLLTM